MFPGFSFVSQDEEGMRDLSVAGVQTGGRPSTEVSGVGSSNCGGWELSKAGSRN